MMKLPQWWRVHFLRVEWYLALLITVILVGGYEYDKMPQEITSTLSGSRSALYAEYSRESVPLILEESVPPNSGWI